MMRAIHVTVYQTNQELGNIMSCQQVFGTAQNDYMVIMIFLIIWASCWQMFLLAGGTEHLEGQNIWKSTAFKAGCRLLNQTSGGKVHRFKATPSSWPFVMVAMVSQRTGYLDGRHRCKSRNWQTGGQSALMRGHCGLWACDNSGPRASAAQRRLQPSLRTGWSAWPQQMARAPSLVLMLLKWD